MNKEKVKNCEYCKKRFVPHSRGAGRFCSQICYINYEKKFLRVRRGFNCEVCGIFVDEKRHGKYCSTKCGGIGRSKPKLEKECPGCGKKFKAASKYCSKTCYNKTTIKHKKQCPTCGNWFVSNTKYCSKKCYSTFRLIEIKRTGMKRCPKCNELKGVDLFYKSRSKRDGLEVWCKKCSYEHNTKRKTNEPSFALKKRIRDRIRSQIKRGTKNGKSSLGFLGYTIDELKKHIENQFEEWMTWENYGYGWHIDHIIPVCAFNVETERSLDFERCWALKNLRPLRARENRIKGRAIEIQFQPSLGLTWRAENQNQHT